MMSQNPYKKAVLDFFAGHTKDEIEGFMKEAGIDEYKSGLTLSEFLASAKKEQLMRDISTSTIGSVPAVHRNADTAELPLRLLLLPADSSDPIYYVQTWHDSDTNTHVS